MFFDHDAYYQYYLHGPLARAVIGDKQIQGVDYAYTIQGWLKAVNGDKINGPALMGQDGYPGRQNGLVGYDYYGFSLGYFTGDYNAIGNFTSATSALVDDAPMGSWDLFNGNISRMKEFNLGLSGHPLGTATDTAIAYRYRYDQLNRLTGMNAEFYIYNAGDSSSTYTAMPDYGEHVSYDPNGNILSYFRNGTTINGGPLAMDSLTYRYQQGNNKLDHVNDAVPATNYSVDIDNEDTLNYNYDQIGNLTKDTSAGIDSIYWTVYGKIQQIVKYNGDTIKFHYGPDGNRIAKEVFVDSLHRWTGTYYVHDAQGNIMATYQRFNRDTFNLDELVMYGSSRLGTLSANIVLSDTALRDTAYYAAHDTSTNPFTDSVTYFTSGLKQYEFTNHLGNVLLTLTDRHIPMYIFGSFVLYKPEVASAQDYYPFGMEMIGRAYNPALYRFGFNGKENDNEVKGAGNSVDYTKRIFDPRVARFLSVDPLTAKYPWYTPYQFAGNKPIWAIDLDGLEEAIKTIPRLDYLPVTNQPDAGTVFAHALSNVGAFIYNTGTGLLNIPANAVNTISENSQTDGGVVYNFVNQTDKSAVQFQNDLIHDPKKVAKQLEDVATNPASYEGPAQLLLTGKFIGPIGETAVETPAVAEEGTATLNAGETNVVQNKVKETSSRNTNKLEPNKNAGGDHTTFSRDKNGNIYKYETYKKTQNGHFDPQKRFDGGNKNGGSGAPHNGVTTPHVQGKAVSGGVRKPTPSETPKNARFSPKK